MQYQSLLCLVTFLLSFVAADFDGDVTTWTKSGIRYRARSATVQPQYVTLTETQTTIPTATLQLRSLIPPVKRSVKRAFLNGWSYQGCVADDDKLPPLISPFPYQLSTEEVSGATCMDFCDSRGNSLAATQNGNECWCGEQWEAHKITFVDDSKCNMPCAAASGELCGGKDSLSIYARASD